MRIAAIIMAGGKGTRFSSNIEKPMAEFMEKPLIRRVIDATRQAKKISEIYVAVTSISPKTAQEAKNAGVIVLETNGKGYHEDVQQAVQVANLHCPVLILSSDLPLINGEFLDEIITKYERSGKPALTVMIPEEAFQKYGLSAVSLYEHQGKKFAVSGINIIDGQHILEEQEQEVVASSKPEAVFTVNSVNDLEAVKKYIKKQETDS
ncbi:MAG: NTP transferase domain-containing protein [Candidatus Bathyarchaeota archaeon]|nr:NTP transferase domain-containing protein [Candidatus Bathyarchaeum tardum]WGM90017.1 MAG: NTP transferase domain-containing protein [Candidatus Bathyarchaeum tardum]WNZ29842.1 MAG: NTP transferase domain-containing protein [Candidatus Bathyarchaeota archaeon]